MKETIKKKIVKNKLILAISIFIAMSILISFGVIYATNFALKGELNDDGKIDYADVELLELHLIHKKELPEEKFFNADMNSDDKITVTDLTLLIRKIEKTLDYEVTLSDIEQENYYPHQNEEITLKFNGEVNYDASIKKAVINGQEYEVKKSDEVSSEYTFKTNTGNVGGIKEYHFTEVILDNGKKVKVDYTIKIDVLKQVPTFENYLAEPDTNEIKMKLSFDIVDKEDTIVEATLEVRNEEEQVVQEETLQKGRNNIDVPMENGKEYKAIFIIRYDLDSNKLPQEVEHIISEYIVKDLQIVADYDFQISDIETRNKGNQTTTFEKEQPIELIFESSNVTKFEVATITVNQKEYSVTKQEDKYLAIIDGITKLGENELVIEDVTLENGKKFTLENDNKVTVNIIKAKPTVTELETVENVKENNMEVSFNLIDEDKTIKQASIILLDKDGVEIERQTLTQDEIQNAGVKIQKTLTTKETSKYKIKIIATYNQTGEEADIVDAILLEQEVKAEARANIVNVTCSKVYPQKGENVTLTYEINTNKEEAINKIRVSNIECVVTKLEDGRYQVTLPVSTKSGIQDLTATQIIYSDEKIAEVNKTIQVDVLKDIPTSEKFTQTDNIDARSVTLKANIIDPDGAFISGKAVLVRNSDKKEIASETFDPINHATFTINNLDLDTEYTMYAYMTYDRDTNRIDSNPQQENYADNYVVDEQFRERPIQLIADYELKLKNIKTYNEEKETSYFEKKQKITLSFDCTNKTTNETTNETTFYPVTATINGKEYELTKEQNTYQTQIDGFDTAGEKDITIESVTLNNTKILEVVENNQTKIGILKDKPTATNFAYKENLDETVTATFNIVDEEDTLTGGKVVVYSQEGAVVKQEDIVKGANTIEFVLNASENEFYTLKVLANYDLDTNTLESEKNKYQNIELLNETINIGKRLVEMKDIDTIELYRKDADSVKEITSLRQTDLANLDEYIVKVNMDELDSFYAPIKEYKIEDNEMKFVLDYDEHVQYIGDKKYNKLEVTYGIVKDDIAQNQNLQELIEAIREDPSGNFELYKDYNLSGITILDNDTVFTGTLNGNGHTLSNLTTRLFNRTNGATIENLVISDFDITANGALINESTNTTIKNVHVKNATVRTPNASGTGSLIGTAKQNSIIENCSATNILVGNSKRTGGFIGMMYASTIKNCYITGRVNASSDAAGGVIGEAFSNSIIENFYANIITNYNGAGGSRGGIIGNPSGITLKNCISLATAQTDGHGAKVYGSYNNSKISGASTNVYELSTSNMTPNNGKQGIKEVTPETLKTKEFYTETLGWDEDVWDMSNVQNGEYPTLKSDPVLKAEKEKEKPNNEDIYLPDYSRIKKIVNYDEQREIAYYNMYKLMPFYDAKYYVEDGNKIAKDHVLNTKKIKYIFAYDANGKWIGALSQKEKDSIKTVRILFTDDESVTYNVSYKEDTGKIVHYKIDELGIEYNYDKYLINTDSPVYQHIVNQTRALDYVNDIATLTPETEVRNYTENYPHVQENAEKFALYLLANTEEYNVSITNSVLETKLIQDLSKDNTLKRLLYGYNYFDRFYNIEIGGINIRDIVYFDGSLFNEKLHATMVSKNLVESASQNDRATTNLTNFYNSYIRPYTGQSIGPFLEYFMQNLTIEKYKQDPGSWIIDNFEGPIYEAPAPRFTEIRYRVWEHLKARDFLILPALSYHGDDLYILGIPTCVMVGNLDSSYYLRGGFGNRKYSDITKEERIAYLKLFADKATKFYDSIAGIINERGYNNMKNRTMINYDNTSNKNWSNEPDTREVYKKFFEVLNKYTVHGAASAYANGTDIYWVYDALAFYNIYTHEAVHNQDGNTFLEGTGRRRGANAEYFTDGFLTQGISDTGIIPNYTFDFGFDNNKTTNLSSDRINTREKIDDYYSKMFNTFAVLDYLEAKAFLQLTPEEQSQVAYVITETEGSNIGLSYGRKTAEEFRQMNLKTIEDLWDNKIVIIRDGTGLIGSTDWYVLHNDNGLVNKGRFILVAYQMLADFGYDGYVAYAGNQYGTDLSALQAVGGEDMTWKKYQMGRYDKVAKNLENSAYFDEESLIEEILTRTRNDISNGVQNTNLSSVAILRQTIYGHLKRVTNDFTGEIFTNQIEQIHIKTAAEFRSLIEEKPYGEFVLDNDIDVSGLTDGDGIIRTTFYGTLDGNGHKITGNTLPIFYKLNYAYVKNLNIEGANIEGTGSYFGALTKVATNSNLTNITGKNISVSGTVNEIGALIGNTSRTYMKNMHVSNVQVSGAGRVGILGGYASYVTVEGCSSNGTVTATGNAVGGFFGQFDNSSARNSYSLGSISGRADVGGFIGWSGGTTSIKNCFSKVTTNATGGLGGGFIGQIKDTGHIENCIAFGDVNSSSYKFDGRSANTMFDNFKNNYELDETKGHSSSEKTDVITSITLNNVTEDLFKNTLGFDTQVWDLTNVSNGMIPKLKKLDPNSDIVDPNENIKLMNVTEIRNVEEFLKLSENPSGDYILTQDIDFTGFTKENASSVISEIFTGRILGNGHTIRNLNGYALFTNFRGIVYNVNIENFTNTSEGRGNGDFVAAFAEETFTATFKNMRFNNITLSGRNNVAVVTGMDGRNNANSVFENISVKNANVTGTGVYVSTFAGRKYNGRMKDIYVQGTLNVTGTENGGLVGAMQQGGTIENIITDVSITKESNSYSSVESSIFNASLVGNIYNTPNIRNSVAFGNMTGYTDTSGNKFAPYKFTGALDAQVNACINNCYEVTEEVGLSRVNDNTAGHLNTISRQNLNKEFYKNLGFDETIWNLDNINAKGYPELK